LLHDHLLLSNRWRPASRLGQPIRDVCGVVAAGRDHTKEEIGAVVLNSSSKHLLISWNGRGPFHRPESVDRRANTQVANALHSDIGTFFWAGAAFGPVLDRDLGKADTDSPNITSENISSIESLAGTNSIIKTLEVDWRSSETEEKIMNTTH
jgi:hypothetical protein